MNKIEQAKKILRKAILLDDAELIAIANELLGINVDIDDEPEVEASKTDIIQMTTWVNSEVVDVDNEPEVPVVKPAPPVETAVETKTKTETRETDFDSFKMSKDEDISRKNGVAVNKIKREIQFVDDGSDKDISTPEISRSERRRKPFQKVEQKCEKCGRTVETHPTHKREFFVCDGCIRK